MACLLLADTAVLAKDSPLKTGAGRAARFVAVSLEVSLFGLSCALEFGLMSREFSATSAARTSAMIIDLCYILMYPFIS